METMKALVLKAYNEFSYEDIPVPEIADDEVLVKIKAVAICGSDVHGYDGASGRRIPPIVMGHEASGEIVKIGPRVSHYKAGDRVTFDSTVYCGECEYCRKGMVNLCLNRTILGVSCNEYRRYGCMAEYCNIPERILYKLPDEVSFETAALVEPLSIGWHAAAITPTEIGDTALVIGAGTIGQMVIKVLRHSNVGRIIVSDPDEFKQKEARKSGADVVLGRGADVVQEVRRLTGGKGADVAFEAVGLDITVNTAIQSVKKGGSVTLIGNVSPKVSIPLQDMITRQLTLRASAASSGEYPQCLAAIADGRVDLGNIISKVAPLSEGALWFDRLHNGESGLMKVVLVP
ncbi:MAG: galactitol-1-phosphate 5-dehydrogenase [Lachnospiraceae bacterium]|nr:galactitol-1-phosphate 5-dehydrogenase [Lachnospiraceae bacterium]